MKKLKLDELKRYTLQEYKFIEKIPVIVVLDNIRSAFNVGAIFRTADAFLIKKIYLCGITAKPPHKEIHKSALGSVDSVNWEYVEDTLKLIIDLKNHGHEIISIEQANGSKTLNEISITPNKKYVLVFGNEVDGVSQEIIDVSNYCVEIEQFGTKHSLNVSVCAGIVLHFIFNQTKNPT